MTGAERIAATLSEAERHFIRVGSWQGYSLYDPLICGMNALELLHLDVLKAENGNVRKWKARLTPLGEEVRTLLTEGEGK